MIDIDKERRAYELLRWVPFALPSEFDEELAAKGHYTKMQRQRSDQALDEVPEHETSSELTAFHELERIGVFTQDDFFSPSKAADGYYRKRLRAIQQRRGEGGGTQSGNAASKYRQSRRQNRRYDNRRRG